MHNIRLTLLTCFLIHSIFLFGQQSGFETRIDSLISAETQKPFNGIILISQDGKVEYSNIQGYSDIYKRTQLKSDDQFVIGSISKQFTAVIVLQEVDKGRIDLFSPIHKYLPELSQDWADTVTVHDLLSHTHGIVALDKPTIFRAGTRYDYSQIGYDLLAKIVEQTSKKSFSGLSDQLFKSCQMTNTFHPDKKKHKRLVKGYVENADGSIIYAQNSFDNYVAAGAFISTANDLVVWNQNLHSGKLLKENTYKIMITKQTNAVREHPIFGTTYYGYGITVDDNSVLQLGQTGYASGFASMDYYFPDTKISVVVLENMNYDTKDIKKMFFYHVEILKIIREYDGHISKTNRIN